MDKDFSFSNLLAIDFSKNKDWWWRWFDIIAKRYCIKFWDSQEKLFDIIKTLEEKDEELNIHEIAKVERITNYWSLFQALKLNSQDIVEIDEKIMDNFQKIDNQKELILINDVIPEIEKEIQITNVDNDEKLQLEDLYKIVIFFYKDEKIRKDFYLKNITKEKNNFDYFLPPINNLINFNNNTL